MIDNTYVVMRKDRIIAVVDDRGYRKMVVSPIQDKTLRDGDAILTLCGKWAAYSETVHIGKKSDTVWVNTSPYDSKETQELIKRVVASGCATRYRGRRSQLRNVIR